MKASRPRVHDQPLPKQCQWESGCFSRDLLEVVAVGNTGVAFVGVVQSFFVQLTKPREI